MNPKAQLRAALKRIKQDATRVQHELERQAGACNSDSRSMKYSDAAYRLECLLVHVNSELDNL